MSAMSVPKSILISKNCADSPELARHWGHAVGAGAERASAVRPEVNLVLDFKAGPDFASSFVDNGGCWKKKKKIERIY